MLRTGQNKWSSPRYQSESGPGENKQIFLREEDCHTQTFSNTAIKFTDNVVADSLHSSLDSNQGTKALESLPKRDPDMADVKSGMAAVPGIESGPRLSIGC